MAARMSGDPLGRAPLSRDKKTGRGVSLKRAASRTLACASIALPLLLSLASCGGRSVGTSKTGPSLYGAVFENPDAIRTSGIRSKSDDTDFRRAQEFHTARAYLRYIERHPDGRHTRQARRQAEHLSYLDAIARRRPAELRDFLRKYPQSPFASQARERLQGVDFKAVRQKDSIPAYRAFLKRHKGAPSEWTAAATQRLERLLLDKVKLGGKELALSRYIYDNPGSPYMAEAKEALRTLAFERVTASAEEDDWLQFLRRFKGSVEARRVARHMREERLRAAERSGSASALEKYLLLYPQTPHKGRILTALSLMAHDRAKEGGRWVKVKMAEIEVSRPLRCKECPAALRIRGTLASTDKDFAYDVVLEAVLIVKGKRCCAASHRVRGLAPGERRAFSFPIPGKEPKGPPPAFRLRIKKWSAYRNTPPGGLKHKREIQASGEKAPVDRFKPVPVPSPGK